MLRSWKRIETRRLDRSRYSHHVELFAHFAPFIDDRFTATSLNALLTPLTTSPKRLDTLLRGLHGRHQFRR